MSTDNVEDVWPDELMLRDTHLHDDMGGLGQRIYTTAGQGYAKEKYVRDVLVAELRKENERLSNALDHLAEKYGALSSIRDRLLGWWEEGAWWHMESIIADARASKEKQP